MYYLNNTIFKSMNEDSTSEILAKSSVCAQLHIHLPQLMTTHYKYNDGTVVNILYHILLYMYKQKDDMQLGHLTEANECTSKHLKRFSLVDWTTDSFKCYFSIYATLIRTRRSWDFSSIKPAACTIPAELNRTLSLCNLMTECTISE